MSSKTRSVFGRPWCGWLGGIVLVAVACGGGGEAPTAALSEHLVGGDLLLVMQPGEGTANHVAWFDGEYGPVDVVTFTTGRDNRRGGGAEFCIMFGGGGGCGLAPDEPILHGYGAGLANAYGGADGAEAVFTTESGNTVSVLTVAGYAHAEWPQEWGLPKTAEFYDTSGSLVVRLDVQADSGE